MTTQNGGKTNRFISSLFQGNFSPHQDFSVLWQRARSLKIATGLMFVKTCTLPRSRFFLSLLNWHYYSLHGQLNIHQYLQHALRTAGIPCQVLLFFFFKKETLKPGFLPNSELRICNLQAIHKTGNMRPHVQEENSSAFINSDKSTQRIFDHDNYVVGTHW